MIRWCVALAMASFCLTGQAACETGLAERMQAKLYPDRRLDHDRAVCEPWRGFMGRFIVVLPMPRPPQASAPELSTFDLAVLVVQQADNGNTERAKVIGRFFQTAALSEDAVRIAEIKVDTARYTLANDAHAFGLRIVYRGSARTNPYESERLSLFVPEGKGLLRVLDSLELTLERGEWDASCAGRFETVRSGLSVLRSASSGYADLQLHQTRVESISTPQGDECHTREQPASFRTSVLHFDGRIYRTPKGVTAN